MLYVRSLIPADAPFPRGQLTAACIVQWISSRPVAPPTQRKYRACLSSFCQSLVVQTGVLTHNPCATRSRRRPATPRDRHDGGDAFDGWRPRTKRDCVIVRAIDYVHIEDARLWIHRFTSGVRLTFSPPAIAVGRADINLSNSRGGTRTRDPGIMSAVL